MQSLRGNGVRYNGEADPKRGERAGVSRDPTRYCSSLPNFSNSTLPGAAGGLLKTLSPRFFVQSTGTAIAYTGANGSTDRAKVVAIVR